MKNRSLLLSIALIPVLAIALFLAPRGENERTYSPRPEAKATMSVDGAMEYWQMLRANPATGEVDPADVERARKLSMNFTRSKAANLTWDLMGPTNRGGRTRTIIFDRNNPSIMYAGAVSGGLWKSITNGNSWQLIENMEHTKIGCLVQGKDGSIYAGTGEYFTSKADYLGYTPGWEGIGIYKMEAGDTTHTFVQLAPTSGWTYINELDVNQTTGAIYAATNTGLHVSNDNGATWTKLTGVPGIVTDVCIASDGTIVAVGSNKVHISTDGSTFVDQTGGGKLPAGNGRIEVAVAPSDPNYIYALISATSGVTKGIYRTTDKGSSWTQIGPAASEQFNPLGDQGNYNNIIAVYPTNKNKILVGGIDLYSWSDGGTWTQVTSSVFSEGHPLYLHVDQHEIVFHPNNPSTIFIGNDGGIFRSLDNGISFQMANRNYSTIQYYSIACSGSGQVIGGTQDNSNQFIHNEDIDPGTAKTLWVGDGGYACISQINPEAIFLTSQFGNVGRTADAGLTWQGTHTETTTTPEPGFFSIKMLEEGTPGAKPPNSWGPWVTPMIMWENHNVPNAKDSVLFVADTSYMAGEVVTVLSKNNHYPFEHTLLAPLDSAESVKVANPVQSMYILCANKAIYMTRQHLNFGKTPKWFKLGAINSGTQGTIHTASISKDGDHLFIGTTNGTLFRFSGLQQAYDSASADMNSAGYVVTKDTIRNFIRPITSIAIDPNDADHVVISLGGYVNNATHIYRSINATSSSATFVGKQGAGASRLPSMPVYAALIPMHNSDMLIVGTEFGIFSTDNLSAGSPSWSKYTAGDDMVDVPVVSLVQQIYNFPYNYYLTVDGVTTLVTEFPATSNYGVIYAGTHGRGAYKALNFVGIQPQEKPELPNFKSSLMVYPNPVEHNTKVVFNLRNKENVDVNVYNLSGQLVSSQKVNNVIAGRNEVEINMSGQKPGTYLIQVVAGNSSKVAKVIKK